MAATPYTGAKYNSPKGSPNTGTKSTIGEQARTDYYNRKALNDVLDEFRLTQLCSLISQPKHFGTEMVRDRKIRILNDLNDNNQGLDSSGATYAKGNLYGSSKDITTINSKSIAIPEEGGRVNRVGLQRLQQKGSMQEYGVFTEWTANTIDFDSNPSLQGDITTEMMRLAAEVYEDKLSIDLISGAGTQMFTGAATSVATHTGEGAEISLVSYADLKRLQRKLEELKAPKSGKILKGVNLTDTVTLDFLRTVYIGYELQPVLEAMVDEHGERAFIPREKYASQMTPIAGEIGMVAGFRVVIAPRMLKNTGKGADSTNANAGYMATDNKYDVFPMLVVTPEAFSTITFQSSNASAGKFSVKLTKPGVQTEADPYGKRGRMSLQWWYGMMITDPMWLAVIHTVAPV